MFNLANNCLYGLYNAIRSSPTEVEGIRDKKIGRVECGCKHTAALVILSSSIDKKSKSSWLTM